MSTADRRAWEAARTLADLGELTAQWLEGAIASQPAYTPGCGPDPETAPLIPVLACCNRAGYVTNGSQPGEAGTGYDGAWWEQRAAVEGFASPAVAERIWEAAEPAGLTVIAHAPATLPRWRIRYDQAVPVTRAPGAPLYPVRRAAIPPSPARRVDRVRHLPPRRGDRLVHRVAGDRDRPRLGPQRPALAGPAQRPDHRR